MGIGSEAAPRWEWRTFGRGFGHVDAAIHAAGFERRLSHETYLLSVESEANVKLRDERLDVKVLLCRDRGLELWSPVLYASLPIDREAIAALFRHWSVAAPPLTQATYTASEFLDNVIERVPLIHRIDVDKDRRIATIDGCLVESSDLLAAGERLRTVAIEAADADRALAMVRKLGLSNLETMSYVEALRRKFGVHALVGVRRFQA